MDANLNDTYRNLIPKQLDIKKTEHRRIWTPKQLTPVQLDDGTTEHRHIWTPTQLDAYTIIRQNNWNAEAIGTGTTVSRHNKTPTQLNAVTTGSCKIGPECNDKKIKNPFSAWVHLHCYCTTQH